MGWDRDRDTPVALGVGYPGGTRALQWDWTLCWGWDTSTKASHLGCYRHLSPPFLSLPSKCPEGTCDGCTFHFLWVTAEGCPRCSSSHHRPIVSACIGGVQKTTYVWREPRLCHGGDALPPQLIQACRSVDFWLKVGISTGTCVAVLLATLAAYFWKKTQKLEYKYSKLVMDAAARESEATSPDSCAIMEGEDVEDELHFATEMSLFGKLKALTDKVRRGGGCGAT
uniref:Endosome-lysosome associated apoptosis and autophagy regulator 1 n=1 Tax=Malurus cyaneus samueli TaxID=2593467 RepID=A0A8C5T3V0_9PASS